MTTMGFFVVPICGQIHQAGFELSGSFFVIQKIYRFIWN